MTTVAQFVRQVLADADQPATSPEVWSGLQRALGRSVAVPVRALYLEADDAADRFTGTGWGARPALVLDIEAGHDDKPWLDLSDIVMTYGRITVNGGRDLLALVLRGHDSTGGQQQVVVPLCPARHFEAVDGLLLADRLAVSYRDPDPCDGDGTMSLRVVVDTEITDTTREHLAYLIHSIVTGAPIPSAN